jgi:hypothetical protein
MFVRTFAACAGALMLSLAPLSAQASDSNSDAFAHGRARGGWELPEPDELGHVRGQLVERDGPRLFLEARLLPLPQVGERRGGLVEGRLFPVSDAGVAPRAVATVIGTYLVGPDGRGKFETGIFELPDTSDRPERLGQLDGLFRDPRQAGPDVPGDFIGRWRLAR